MKVTADMIIKTASGFIGITEKPINNVVFNTKYYGKEVSGDNYPWCCVFVWYIFQQTNASNLLYDGKKTASCQNLADWFKTNKQWYTNNPQPGDIIFYKFGSSSRYTDHVGIIKSVNQDGSIIAIEGNTSDSNNRNGGSVLERIRSKNIVGFGRPNYSTNVTNTIVKSISKGIDVSAYQTNLNYRLLKQNGCQFAILKIVDKQLQKDIQFETHYKGFTQENIPIFGVYQYSYAKTIEKARIDAQAVIKALNGRKIPVALDIEDSCLKNLGHVLIDIINAYQRVIEDAGLAFFIYSGLSFIKTYIVPYINDLKCKDFWIARYYKSNTPMEINEQLDDSKKPTIQGINLIGWQFTSNGIITGSQGRLDCNIFYQKPNAVSTSTQTTGVVTANALKIRTAPNTDSDVAGYLKKDEKVTIINADASTGWYQIPQGWVSNKYISII